MRKFIIPLILFIITFSGCEMSGEKPVMKELYEIRFENVSEGSEVTIRGIDGTIIRKTVRNGEFTYEEDLQNRNVFRAFCNDPGAYIYLTLYLENGRKLEFTQPGGKLHMHFLSNY